MAVILLVNLKKFAYLRLPPACNTVGLTVLCRWAVRWEFSGFAPGRAVLGHVVRRVRTAEPSCPSRGHFSARSLCSLAHRNPARRRACHHGRDRGRSGRKNAFPACMGATEFRLARITAPADHCGAHLADFRGQPDPSVAV